MSKCGECRFWSPACSLLIETSKTSEDEECEWIPSRFKEIVGNDRKDK